MDDKGRITIPSDWRAARLPKAKKKTEEGEKAVEAEKTEETEKPETFLATPHPDGYIAVLPPGEVDKLHDKISAQKLSDAAAQAFSARFFSRTLSFTYDTAGRAGLTPELLKHAGIEKEAVLVGSLTKFNIYSPARWAQEEARTAGENFGDLMRRLDL